MADNEPTEGDFREGDVPGRRLTAFLELCGELGIHVIARPGPYSYSELVNCGLPQWLFDKYPEIRAQDASGSSQAFEDGVSYLHPVFLQKAKRYLQEVCKRLVPYLDSNGGPVQLVQLDNELAGIHIWRGSLDYNPEAMGIGNSQGRYTAYLEKLYQNTDNLNSAYGTDYTQFCQADPRCKRFASGADEYSFRVKRDYYDFYISTLSDYMNILADHLTANGIDVPFCTNAATVGCVFDVGLDGGREFLYGVDHYYNLSPKNPVNAPTPQNFLRRMRSLDMLYEMGMPPSVMEIQTGNICDYPPILKEDLLAFYMSGFAAGMKGLNYYVFTGGVNFENTGITCDVYDYNAPVSADNVPRDTLNALAEFNAFALKYPQMQTCHRYSDVQLAIFECSPYQKLMPYYGKVDRDADEYMVGGIHTALIAGGYQCAYKRLDNAPDINKPLIICVGDCMSRQAQQAVIDFIDAGGKAVIGPKIPRLDEKGGCCTILADYLDFGELESISGQTVTLKDTGRAYNMSRMSSPSNPGLPLIKTDGERTVVSVKNIGRGTAVFAGMMFDCKYQSHVSLMRQILESLGCMSTVRTDNINVWTTLFCLEKKALLFAVNLYSGAQSAEISCTINGKQYRPGKTRLAAMSVDVIEIEY